MNRSHEYASMLLQKARDDQYVLERLAQDADAPTWAIGFHAQQAVEKAIKAVLANRGVEYPRTHNLTFLVDLLRERGIEGPPDAEELDMLTPFGAVLRYEAYVDAEPEKAIDRPWARECVRRTFCWAEGLIGVGEGEES